MIVDMECLPNPPGTGDNPYKHVEAAIAVIQASGLRYAVNALGSTIEGEPDLVWATVRKAHEACLAAGANGLVSIVKIQQSAPTVQAPTIETLTGKFRG
jgi:uncharacterized protein YqgV (UPF0045/DUF77 family)